MDVTDKRAVDRRIQRTERNLHQALSVLIHEKPYDAIAVKEILHRADVGRSTFYTHFREKDELLVSGIRDMIDSGRPPNRSASTSRSDDVLWFSLPFFTHVEQHRRTSRAPTGGAKARRTVHGHLQRLVTELVAEELKPERRDDDSQRRLPLEILAQHVAATFVLVLNWWVESGSPLTAGEVNEHFRALVLPLVTIPT